MAGHEETHSKADPERAFESAVPANRPVLHREPPVLEGTAIKEPVPPAPGAAKKDARPADKYVPKYTFEMASPFYKPPVQASEPLAEPPVKGLDPETGSPEPPPQAAAGRGLSPVVILAVAFIGALSGFAAAYAGRYFFDDKQTAFDALDQRLDAVSSKLAADEKKIDAASSGSHDTLSGSHDTLSAFEKRLGAVEKTAQEALSAAAAARTEATQAGDAGTSMPVAAAPVPMPDLTPLQSRIDDLEKRLAQLETTVNAPKIAERATQEPEAKPDPALANAPAIAIIAENLVQKIGSGIPYATELAALDKLGADKTKLAVLQPSAASGVATTQALADELNALTPSLLGSEKPAGPADEGVLARIVDHAKNLVHVSKTGDLSGGDLPARLARVQNALAHDDIGLALQEWASFPEAAKTATAHWAEAAKARAAALNGAKAIVSGAMTNLTKVKS